jgi:uncharacterized membrane protein
MPRQINQIGTRSAMTPICASRPTGTTLSGHSAFLHRGVAMNVPEASPPQRDSCAYQGNENASVLEGRGELLRWVDRKTDRPDTV